MSRSIIFAAARAMASPTLIVLILTYVCLVVCRLEENFNEQPTTPTEDKEIQEVNKITTAEPLVVPKIKTNADVVPEAKTIRDEDATVFPKDEDTNVYLNVNKIIKEVFDTMDNNKHNNAASTTFVPFLPEKVPVVEAKEAFTNQIVIKDEDTTYKTKDNITTTQATPIQEVAVASDIVTEENSNITVDNNETTIIRNDSTTSNETVPDFSTRFGGTGNYLIVPANNIPTYETVQVPTVSVRGNVRQYGTYTAQRNTITPFTANAGTYAQYAAPNANIPNVANPPYSYKTNVFRNEPYTAPNVPIPYNVITQGTHNVPISAGNTYMINGQMYTAVAVPNNIQYIPSSVYLLNSQLPQGSGYQANNNLPLLVSVG